jgi:DNA-binding CsgD family transcriptional regulator
MNSALLQLSESTFQDILSFVANSGRLSERKPFYDSLRHLGRSVLKLDEMVIGRCDSGSNTGAGLETSRCSSFNPMVSLIDAPATPASPCGSTNAGCATQARIAEVLGNAYEEASAPPSGRVVVCHRRKIEASALCLLTSATERSEEELSALLNTLLPYVCDAIERLEPERPKKGGSTLQSRTADASAEAEPIASLTGREQEVLHWTAKGKGCWEIGLIVGISERTVKFHLQNIYRKLNVVNRAQAVAKAAENKLLLQ